MNDSTSFNMLSELIDKKSAKQIDAIKSKVSSQVNNEINTRLSKALSIKTDADKKIKDQKQKLNDKVNNLVEQGENITTTISEIEKNVAKQSNETIVNINEALESDSAESSPKSQTSNDNKV
jgi:myo-inositol-1-phosphate synthase